MNPEFFDYTSIDIDQCLQDTKDYCNAKSLTKYYHLQRVLSLLIVLTHDKSAPENINNQENIQTKIQIVIPFFLEAVDKYLKGEYVLNILNTLNELKDLIKINEVTQVMQNMAQDYYAHKELNTDCQILLKQLLSAPTNPQQEQDAKSGTIAEEGRAGDPRLFSKRTEVKESKEVKQEKQEKQEKIITSPVPPKH
jgi:hypothetical protein